MGEPGGLPSVGSHRVGHDRSDLAAAAAAPPGKPYIVYTQYKNICLVNVLGQGEGYFNLLLAM